jgi:hypothetical protein
MDKETVTELFELAAKGEISYFELMDDLEIGGFDGDVFDFL